MSWCIGLGRYISVIPDINNREFILIVGDGGLSTTAYMMTDGLSAEIP